MSKFRNMFSDYEILPSPSGEAIYTFSYLNEDGELVEDSRNIHELIKSSLPMTDFKRRIIEYGIDSGEVNVNAERGVYLDTREFGSGDCLSVSYFKDLKERIQRALDQVESKESGSKSEEASGKA